MGGNSQMMGGNALGNMFMNTPSTARPAGNVPVATQPPHPQMPQVAAPQAPQAAPMGQPQQPAYSPPNGLHNVQTSWGNIPMLWHNYAMDLAGPDKTVDPMSNPLIASQVFRFMNGPVGGMAPQPQTPSYSPSRNQLLAQAINNKYK